MSARVDLAVKRHLDAMHRERSAGARASRPSGVSVESSAPWAGGTPALHDELFSDSENEEILQPRRLSLRVF